MLLEHAAWKGTVFERDHWRCVECGSGVGLQLGHRQSSGHGGRGKKAPASKASDFVTQCARHNEAAEHVGQTRALENGWKVRRNTLRPSEQIPFFDYTTGLYFMPDAAGKRYVIGDAEALTIIQEVNFP